jgi:hypothetical protein
MESSKTSVWFLLEIMKKGILDLLYFKSKVSKNTHSTKNPKPKTMLPLSYEGRSRRNYTFCQIKKNWTQSSIRMVI